MLLLWTNIPEARGYIVYKAPHFIYPTGKLSEPKCVCKGDRDASDPGFDVPSYVDESLKGFLAPPEGYNFYAYTESTHLEVDAGVYVVVAINGICASSYSNPVSVVSELEEKTISVAIREIPVGNTVVAKRFCRWGVFLTKIHWSYNIDSIISTDYNVDIEFSTLTSGSFVLTGVPPTGSEDVSGRSFYKYAFEPLIIKVSTDGCSISQVNIAIDVILIEYPLDVIKNALEKTTVIDRFDKPEPSLDFVTTGYLRKPLILDWVYTDTSGSIDAYLLLHKRGFYHHYDLSLDNKFKPPLVLSNTDDLALYTKGDPGSVVMVSEGPLEVKQDRLPDMKDVYFEGGFLLGHDREIRRIYLFKGAIKHIDVQFYKQHDDAELTIYTPQAGLQKFFIPKDILSAQFVTDIPFDAGSYVVISSTEEHPITVDCDVRIEIWRERPPCICEIAIEEEEEEGARPLIYDGTYFEGGANGWRYKTYPFQAHLSKVMFLGHDLFDVPVRYNFYVNGDLVRTYDLNFATSRLLQFDLDITVPADGVLVVEQIIMDRSMYEVVRDVDVIWSLIFEGEGAYIATYTAADSVLLNSPSSNSTTEYQLIDAITFPHAVHLTGMSASAASGNDNAIYKVEIPDLDISYEFTGTYFCDPIIEVPPYTTIRAYYKVDNPDGDVVAYPQILLHIGFLAEREEFVDLDNVGIFWLREHSGSLYDTITHRLALPSGTYRCIFLQASVYQTPLDEADIIIDIGGSGDTLNVKPGLHNVYKATDFTFGNMDVVTVSSSDPRLMHGVVIMAIYQKVET